MLHGWCTAKILIRGLTFQAKALCQSHLVSLFYINSFGSLVNSLENSFNLYFYTLLMQQCTLLFHNNTVYLHGQNFFTGLFWAWG